MATVNQEKRFIVSMLTPMFCFLVLFYLYPTLFNLYTSFTDLSLLGLKRGGAFIGLKNYVKLIFSKNFYSVLWNTAFWLTAVSVGVRIILGFALALLINSEVVKRYRLTTPSRLILIVPWATPPVVCVIVFRWFLDQRFGTINQVLLKLGLIDSPIAFLGNVDWVWPSLILVITWNTLPMVALTFLAALQSIPEESIEAAKVDGATAVQRTWHIIIPHLRPTILVVTLLSVFWTFNNFLYVWLTTGGGPGNFTNVITTEIFIQGFINYDLGYSSTIGIAATLIMGAFALVYVHLAGKREFERIL